MTERRSTKAFAPGRLRRCAVAALAAAVTLACDQAGAASYRIVTTKVQNQAPTRADKVTAFTDRTLKIMATKGSARYLENRRLADSSTFAARTVQLMNTRVIRPSPVLPIAQRDLTCYSGVPSYAPDQKADTNTTPVTVEADKMQGDLADKSNDLTYTGRVVITQADRVINTDKARYDDKSRNFTVSGKSVMHSGEYTVHTDEDGVYGIDSREVDLKNTRFQFNGSMLRGTAVEQHVDSAKRLQTYKDAVLTTCPADSSVWTLHATTVEIDRNKSFGEAWNPTVWLGPVPVYYMPYVNFPITNERKTGLLYPAFSIGTEHFRYSQPIYFNLAPNYDLTFTPAWKGERRWQFTTQFRYLPLKNLSGQIFFNYLPNDTHWTPYDRTSDHKRWFLNWTNSMTLMDNDLVLGMSYQRVRPEDYNYLSDLGEGGAITDDHLTQTLSATYAKPSYRLRAELRRYQSLLPEYAGVFRARPFAMLPKLSGDWGGTSGRAALSVYGETTRFTLEPFDDYSEKQTVRAHFEPHFEYHLFDQRGATLDAGGRLFVTHYHQGSLDHLPQVYHSYFGFNDLDKSRTRFLYELEMRGRMSFERKMLDMRHTETLEPEIMYQYVPYRDQRNIAIYDTTDHLDDYYSLFSYRRFSGIDRIADVNAVTAGVTSRILDPHDREVLRVMAAQTYSFVPSRVTLNNSEAHSKYPRSLLTGSLDANPWDVVNIHSGFAYNTESSEFKSYNASLAYNSGGTRVNVNYRFLRDENYDFEKRRTADIRQIGVGLSVPLGRDWRFTAAAYRDLDVGYDINRKASLKYEDCCWSIAFVFDDYTKMDWTKGGHVTEKVAGLQFELKGFYTFTVDGVVNPTSVDTHYLPFADPTNLNR
ncbi:MAG: LPS assembly protein LptD [Succinivibrio sp.]|jgi:LPS-assembly protein|nr:LPS assembly protein LptD [Succinivibrio sp.]